jgi:putative ABC transport system permease protein
MRKRALNIGTISFQNLKAKPVRSACLVLTVAVLAFALFGGAILSANFNQGLEIMAKRFGADLMVVPEGSGGAVQALLLRGEPRYFYFDSDIVDTVSSAEGVVCASPQFFLTSLAADCCDAMVQLIAYDPETDFVVQPWITEKYRGQIEDGQVVVGSRITIRKDDTIGLLNYLYPVAARLSKSASGLDTSIFMTMNTMRLLIARANAEGYDFLSVQDQAMRGRRISAVLVDADPNTSPRSLAAAIKSKNKGVDVVVSQSVLSGIAETLAGFTSYMHIISAVLWLLALVVLAAVFSGTIHERKKEFALLRILGATRKKLLSLVLCESLLTGIAGAVLGIILSCIVLFPFSTLISERLGLPYLNTSPLTMCATILASLFLSALTGPLASLYAALKISGAETYETLREGE